MDRRNFFLSLLGAAIAAGGASSAFAQTSPMAPQGNTKGGAEPRPTGETPMSGSGGMRPSTARPMGAEPRSTADDMPVRRRRTRTRRRVNRPDRRTRPNTQR